MILELDFNSQLPIYLQLRNQIVIGIGKGQLEFGEKLPTVRQMAEDIGINTMTVNKAYKLLKVEGFISIDRRHGAKVNTSFDANKEYKEKLEETLELYISEAKIKGIKKEDFLELCDELFKKTISE